MAQGLDMSSLGAFRGCLTDATPPIAPSAHQAVAVLRLAAPPIAGAATSVRHAAAPRRLSIKRGEYIHLV
jgi:hypothetical protein